VIFDAGSIVIVWFSINIARPSLPYTDAKTDRLCHVKILLMCYPKIFAGMSMRL